MRKVFVLALRFWFEQSQEARAISGERRSFKVFQPNLQTKDLCSTSRWAAWMAQNLEASRDSSPALPKPRLIFCEKWHWGPAPAWGAWLHRLHFSHTRRPLRSH